MLWGPEYGKALVNVAGRHSIFAGALLKISQLLLCGIQRLPFGVNLILLLAAVVVECGRITELCTHISIVCGSTHARFPLKYVQFALQQSDFFFLRIDFCLPLFTFCLCRIGSTFWLFFGVTWLGFTLLRLPWLRVCRCRIGSFGRLWGRGSRQIIIVDHPNRITRFFGRAILACQVTERL